MTTQEQFLNLNNRRHSEATPADYAMIQSRMEEYNRLQGPRVGDFVLRADGRIQRFSHQWDDSLQASTGGSFYLGKGYLSFSGGLDPLIPFGRIVPTGDHEDGLIWVFQGDWMRAHAGVECMVPFRVFREIPTVKDSLTVASQEVDSRVMSTGQRLYRTLRLES